MNPACELCRGACCESIVVASPKTDEGRWLAYHGAELTDGKTEIAAPCSKLCDGKCTVWKNRPMPCVIFEVGGADCRATVKRRRENWREIIEAMPAPLT